MKIPRQRRLPRGSCLMYVDGCPRGILIDKRYRSALSKIPWRWIPKRQRCRGFFGKNETRQYLHRYVLTLARKYYPEITFANGDLFDCRLVNLHPYRREEEGANRCLFRNSTSGRKGVSWHKGRKKWVAMIRVHGKLRHLGYFHTAERASLAYAEARNLAHPNRPLVVLTDRHR